MPQLFPDCTLPATCHSSFTTHCPLHCARLFGPSFAALPSSPSFSFFFCLHLPPSLLREPVALNPVVVWSMLLRWMMKVMPNKTTGDDDGRGFIPSKTAPGRCGIMRSLLGLEP